MLEQLLENSTPSKQRILTGMSVSILAWQMLEKTRDGVCITGRAATEKKAAPIKAGHSTSEDSRLLEVPHMRLLPPELQELRESQSPSH